MFNTFNFIKNNFTPPVIFITFLNIGFFMVVQIAFFYIIASKQIDVIIESKADIIKNYTLHSSKAHKSLQKYMNSDEFKKKKNTANLTKKERLRLNRKIIWIKLQPFLIFIFSIVLVSLLLIIIFSTKSVQSKLKWNNMSDYTLSLSDKVLILFVLGAFSTELLFFFGMVNRYEFIGDMEILNLTYRKFAKHYNNIN
tara:strand:- start:1240 stop:1830 length:591 start_codon:yes stop_codon:yes gene_type:complete